MSDYCAAYAALPHTACAWLALRRADCTSLRLAGAVYFASLNTPAHFCVRPGERDITSALNGRNITARGETPGYGDPVCPPHIIRRGWKPHHL